VGVGEERRVGLCYASPHVTGHETEWLDELRVELNYGSQPVGLSVRTCISTTLS